MGASHESPYIFTETKDGFESGYLELAVNKSLGDNIGTGIFEQSFTLLPNASLVLYTDGLFSVERPDGKKLSELRFGKNIAKKAEFATTAKAMTKLVLQTFEDHRDGNPLPDDVTIVTIRRQGPSRNASLVSESGEVVYETVSR